MVVNMLGINIMVTNTLVCGQQCSGQCCRGRMVVDVLYIDLHNSEPDRIIRIYGGRLTYYLLRSQS